MEVNYITNNGEGSRSHGGHWRRWLMTWRTGEEGVADVANKGEGNGPCNGHINGSKGALPDELRRRQLKWRRTAAEIDDVVNSGGGGVANVEDNAEESRSRTYN